MARGANNFRAFYENLSWLEKSDQLTAMIQAGDHPPGFSMTFDSASLREDERDAFQKGLLHASAS